MKSKLLLSQFTGALVAGMLAFAASAAEPKKVLVVSVTTGFRHGSIGVAEKTIAQLGEESGAFTVVDYARQPTIKVPSKPNPPQKPKDLGGHSFAIIGYNERGLVVQNSWGAGWGAAGFGISA